MVSGQWNRLVGIASGTVTSLIVEGNDLTEALINTALVNTSGVTAATPSNWAVRDNGVGSYTLATTVSVPASGGQVAAVPWCRVFYITASTAGCSVAVGGFTSGAITIPASQAVAVTVPPNQTLTPTYGTGAAPTWVVQSLP